MARILIIEDNETNLELVVYLLTAFGHQSIGARDGEQGLAAAVSEHPDLILCDLQLPGIDGHAVLGRLKLDDATRQIPVVALTALAMVGDRERALAAGFDGYIAKPIVPERFVEEVGRFLDRPKPAPQLAAPASAMPRILVIEDDERSRDFMCQLLRYRSYTVLEAADGNEGLEVARRERPDLVIADVLMPTMDGFEFARELRAHPPIAATPIIFYSASYHGSEARKLAASVGVARFLIKPSDPEKILEAVASVLRGELGKPQAPVVKEFEREHLRLVSDKLAEKANYLAHTTSRLDALVDTGLVLCSERNPDRLFRGLCAAARDLVGAKYAFAAAFDENWVLRHWAVAGLSEDCGPPATADSLIEGIFGRVLRDGKPARVSGPSADAERFRLNGGLSRLTSLLVVPFRTPSTIYGWLCLADRMGRKRFAAGDERIARTLAAVTAATYENLAHYAALRKSTDRLALLHDIDLAMLSARSPEEIAEIAATRVHQLIACERASVLLFDPAAEQATVLAESPREGPGFQQGTSFSLSLLGDLTRMLEDLREARPHLLDLAASPSRTPEIEEMLSHGMRYYHVVPLISLGALVGALSLCVKQPQALTAEDRTIGAEIGAQLAVAIQQAVQRRRIEEAEARYHSLFDHVPVGVFRSDPDGAILDLNPAGMEMLGFPDVESWRGFNAHDLHVEPADFQRVLGTLEREGVVRNSEAQLRRYDGGVIWALTSIRAVHDAEGRLVAHEGVSKDITDRKLAERIQEESYRREQRLAHELQLLLNSTGEGIYGLDEEGRCTFANAALGRMLGYEPSELVGQNMHRLAHHHRPDGSTYPVEACPLFEAFRRGTPCRIDDEVFWRRDGTSVPVEYSSFPIRECGEISGAVVTVTDITERKRAEEARARLAAIVESSADAIIGKTPEGIVTSWNPGAEQLYGYAAAEMIGQSISRIIPSQQEMIEIAEVISRGERIRLHETERVRKDGQRVTVSLTVSPVRDSSGRIVGDATIAHDVTERKTAEDALRERERLLDSLFHASPVGMAIIDREFRYVRINEPLARMNGAPVDAHLGRSVRDVLPELAPIVEPLYREIFASGKPLLNVAFSGETPGARGVMRHWVASYFPISDKRGELTALGGVVLEVTEMKQAEENLREALAKAEESDRLKSAFLANMSHEIRTPLNVISGFAGLIGDRAQTLDDEELLSWVAPIERAINRLLATINGILDISKIEAGSFAVMRIEVDLNTLVDRHIEEFRPLASEKGIVLTCEHEIRASVLFDSYCLTQAITNLLDNAIKFTAAGAILLRVGRDEAGVLYLEVSDTGVGMEPDYLARLFLPFSQEDAGYTRRFEGTGLGLALVKRYLDLNGATISVRSTKGKGSTFRISFPKELEAFGGGGPRKQAPRSARLPTATAAAAVPPHAARPPSRARLLVVEDDADNLLYCRTVLGSRYEILGASSAEEARCSLKADKAIDLILMDVSLKGDEDGLSLTKWIRQSDMHRLPIIAVTAHAFAADRENAIDAGCDGYVAKPIELDKLLSLIETLLPAS